MKFDERGSWSGAGFSIFGYDDLGWDVAECDNGYIVVGEVWNCTPENAPNGSNAVKAAILKLDRHGNVEFQVPIGMGEGGFSMDF